jgi:multidrug resistance efflux pump
MNILPSEFVNNGIDVYLAKHAATSWKTYWLAISIVVISLVSLPFIYVDVSVQEAGIIRPVIEKSEIRAAITEIVDSVYVKEGQFLKQGDTILTFNRSVPNAQIEYRQKRMDDFQKHLNDLQYLAKGHKPVSFSSSVRQQEYTFYIRKKEEYEINLAKTLQDLNRSKILFDKKVIAKEEYENSQHEYDKAKNALVSLKESQITQWQNDLNTCANSQEEMKTAMRQDTKEEGRYVAISPVTGVLDQFNGIYSGSLISVGTTVAIVSPDSTLYAEIYVSPQNIGYIRNGMDVNMQIGAFNYNEWGSISGKVMDISSDFLTDNSGNNVFYRVKCHMEKNYLVRKNGIKGVLKKGMTVSAHFRLTKRSLFDLLYQKMDNWANPAQNSNMEYEKRN